MRKKKILVITGSRAEYGLLRPVLHRIMKSRFLSLQVLITGMHTLKKFGHTAREVQREFPKSHVVSITKKDSMLSALSAEIRGIEKYVQREKPDVILVLGDRDEAFAGAIVGGHEKIVVAHIHGGDTLGYLVDEAIRHSITKFAHLHFPATAQSALRIAKMGEERWRIHQYGSTAFDKKEIASLVGRKQLAAKHSIDLQKPWLLMVQHPTPLDPTPLDNQLSPTLKALQKTTAEKIVIYPNADTGGMAFIRHIDALKKRRDWHIIPSLPRHEYLSFLKHCDVMIGNSSSGIIEAGFFHTPVVNIGARQKGRECGKNVIHVGYAEARIRRALTKALSASFRSIARHSRHPYGAGNASQRIVRALESLQISPETFYKRFSSV